MSAASEMNAPTLLRCLIHLCVQCIPFYFGSLMEIDWKWLTKNNWSFIRQSNQKRFLSTINCNMTKSTMK